MKWSATWGRALGLLGMALLALLMVYWHTWSAMVQIWIRSETFAHAFVVPPISAWLIWRKRSDLARQEVQSCWPALLLLLPLGAVWLMGDMLGANALTQLAVMGMLPVVVLAILGRGVARALFFPLAFLFFCVPVGDFLVPYMMQSTADFTVMALRWSGVPVYREGLHFVIPSGQWSVVEACSGIRYLIASLMVGTLFAYLNFRSLRRRLLFVLVALVTPLVANWLRAYMIVMLGHVSGNKLATGVDHVIYGWVFFGIVMTLMFMLGARWSDEPASETGAAGAASDPVRGSAMAAPSGQDPAEPARQEGPGAQSGEPGLRSLATTVLAMVLLAAPVLVLRQLDQARALPTDADWKMDFAAAGWVACVDMGPDWQAHIEGARLQRRMCLEKDGRKLFVQADYFEQQDFSHKLLSSTNVLVPPDDKHWATVSSEQLQADAAAGVLPMNLSLIRDASMANGVDRKLLAAQTYWVNGRWLLGSAAIRMHGALDKLQGRGDAAASLVAFVALRDEADEASAQSFVQQFFADTRVLWSQQLRALHPVAPIAQAVQPETAY